MKQLLYLIYQALRSIGMIVSYEDVRGNVIQPEDIVTLNYKQRGIVKLKGLELIIEYYDVDFELATAIQCFRVEIVQ